MNFFKSILTVKQPKHLLGTLNFTSHHAAGISKPKVLVTMKDIPKSAIDLLCERLVA